MEYTTFNKKDGELGYNLKIQPSKQPVGAKKVLKALMSEPQERNITGTNAKGPYDFTVYSLFCKDEEEDLAVAVSFPKGTYDNLKEYNDLKGKEITFEVIEKDCGEKLGLKKVVEVSVEGEAKLVKDKKPSPQVTLTESLSLTSEDKQIVEKLNDYKKQGATRDDMFDALIDKNYDGDKANWLLDEYVFV